jgi:hypothetical protein
MTAVSLQHLAAIEDAEHADRAQRRREAIDRDELHLLACIRGERRDLTLDGTVDLLNVGDEVANVALDDADGLRKLVRAWATRPADPMAVYDAARELFDAALERVAVSRLPGHLRDAE